MRLKSTSGAGAVPHVQPRGQLGQQPPQGAVGVGPVAVAVHLRRQEQILRGLAGRAVVGEVPARPLLLLPDDRDDLGVHQDGVGSTVDLRLLVTELGDRCLGVAVARRIGLPRGACGQQRQQRVAVQQADLADTTAQQRHQHGDPHGLLVTEPAVLDRSAEQVQSGHDLGHGVVVDDLTFESGLLLAGQLTASVEPRVLRPESQPARFGQRTGRRVLVVGHEQVELFDIAGQTLHRSRRQPLAGAASTGDPPGTQLTEEVQHEGAHLGGLTGQAGPLNLPAAQERVELLDRDDPAVHRRPAQRSRLQPDLAVPLQAAPQPPDADPVEPHRVAAHRFVIAQGDPSVLDRVPPVQAATTGRCPRR